MEYTKIDPKGPEWKYPMPGEPFNKGWLKVSDNPPHEIFYREYGNPNGEPALFLHGGPGGSTSDWQARFFNHDPEHPEKGRYRIIMFDQRGCGESKPHVGTDFKAGMADNDTAHSIADIEALRVHLGLQSPPGTPKVEAFAKKMHVLGGSWGSTLAMAYAQEHSDHVQPGGLILRGIFLCDKDDLSYFYQGNAARYKDDKPWGEQKFTLVGAYRAYAVPESYKYTIPEKLRDPRMAEAYAKAWHDYVTIIQPPKERENMIDAYHRRFHDPSLSDDEKYKYAKAWAAWEDVTSYLCHDTSPANLTHATDKKTAIAFAGIENEYFYRAMHGKDEKLADLLKPEKVAELVKLMPKIVHGAYDQVCAVFSARKLKGALELKGAKEGIDFEYIETPNAGHAMTERTTSAQMVDYTDRAPKIWEHAVEPQGQQSWTERG